MKKLYLVRHGQTLFNELHMTQGWCDSPLTELGRKQAKEAGRSLRNVDFSAVYTMRLFRTEASPFKKWLKDLKVALRQS